MAAKSGVGHFVTHYTAILRCYGGGCILYRYDGGGCNMAIAASAAARTAICAVPLHTITCLVRQPMPLFPEHTAAWVGLHAVKPCIVLEWCYSHNGGTVGIRTCLDGAASRTYQGSQRYNSSMGDGNFNSNAKMSGTYYKEFVFCSKLETYNSQSDWPAISIAYFPLP